MRIGLGLHVRVSLRSATRADPRPDDTRRRASGRPGRSTLNWRDANGRLRSDPDGLGQGLSRLERPLARTFQRVTGTGAAQFHVLLVRAASSQVPAARGRPPRSRARRQLAYYDEAQLTREFVRTYGFSKAFKSAWSRFIEDRPEAAPACWPA